MKLSVVSCQEEAGEFLVHARKPFVLSRLQTLEDISAIDSYQGTALQRACGLMTTATSFWQPTTDNRQPTTDN
jgi:hypothetical protein